MPETIATTEYSCSPCGATFYADYASAEHCPVCGTSAGLYMVRGLSLTVGRVKAFHAVEATGQDDQPGGGLCVGSY